MAGRTRILISLLIIVLVASCGSEKATNTDKNNPNYKVANNPFELHIGETATLETENLEVTFESLLGDSRCAADVTCIWEGQAEIRLRVVDGTTGDTSYVPLIRRPGQIPITAVKDTLGLRFAFVELDPYPISTVIIPDSERVATLAVFRNAHLNGLDGEVILQDALPRQSDLFQLDTVFIVGDVMHLSIMHSGGCGDHDYELFFSPAAFAESLPVQATLRPRHTDQGDPCDAWLRKDLEFDLRPLAQQYLISYGALDCMVVHVSDDLSGAQTMQALTVTYFPTGMRSTPFCTPESK